MNPIKRLHCGALWLAVLVVVGATNPASAYSVYRRSAANANGVVPWVHQNFGVSGHPSTLSFTYFPDDNAARAGLANAQCIIRVDLGDLIDPQPHSLGIVGNVAIPVHGAHADQPNPFPWTIVFDNQPINHWGIPKQQITGLESNTAASRVAAHGFNSLATTVGSHVTVINGLLPNCAAQ